MRSYFITIILILNVIGSLNAQELKKKTKFSVEVKEVYYI